jgi:hypothetical protein
LDAGRMPDQANPAQGNLNSMPQIVARTKFGRDLVVGQFEAM